MKEILDHLKKEIEKFSPNISLEEVGQVLEVKDGTAKISGLRGVEVLEIIAFGEKKELFGLALNLGEDEVGAIILGDDSKIKEGDIVKRTKKALSIPVGESLLGRIVNPLGEPLDNKGEIKAVDFYPLERIGPSVIEREPVNSPLHTGIKLIDALIPIGRGQRELILGDRITRKDSLAIDAILNQKNEPNRPICIYVAIGQKEAKLARTASLFEQYGALDYTIIVAAPASSPAPFWYLAPYSGCAIGEYFMHKGKDVLVIYDDLTKHALAWRQISLVLRRPPGREAYPGDIFYLHSRLLERAAKLNKAKGGGSLTALPIIETQAGDLTAYIPTNVISISDGQIFMDTSLALRGQRPEVNIGLSVSRVGSAAQTKAMKKVAGTLKLDLAQFQELEAFLEFAEEVDPETKKKIERGRRMREILKQEEKKPLSFEKEVVIIFAGINGFLDLIKLQDIKRFEQELFSYLDLHKPGILKNIRTQKELKENDEKELSAVIAELAKKFS